MLAILSDVDADGAAFGAVIDGVADNVDQTREVQIAFVGADRGIFGILVSTERVTVVCSAGRCFGCLPDISSGRDELQAFFFQQDVGRFQTGSNNSPTKVSMRVNSPSVFSDIILAFAAAPADQSDNRLRRARASAFRGRRGAAGGVLWQRVFQFFRHFVELDGRWDNSSSRSSLAAKYGFQFAVATLSMPLPKILMGR